MLKLISNSSIKLKRKCVTNIIRVIDLRSGIEKIYDAEHYDRHVAMTEPTIYKEISDIDGKETINTFYHIDLDSDSQKIIVYHEKDSYWGSWKGKYFGFHFFLDSSNTASPFIGRADSIGYEGNYQIISNISYNGTNINVDYQKLIGNYMLGLVECKNSKRFSFTEKSKEFTLDYNEECQCYTIGEFMFDTFFFKCPSIDLKDLSSRDMINLLTNYDSICDYNTDFGFRYKQLIKSKNDYYELFRNRYDLKQIIFTDYIPSAASLFKTFENCFSLENVDITLIQGSATVFTRCFANCKKLKTVKILENRNECRIYGIFSGCLSLESVTFPFLQLSASKKWKNDTGKLTDIRVPLMEKFMKF